MRKKKAEQVVNSSRGKVANFKTSGEIQEVSCPAREFNPSPLFLRELVKRELNNNCHLAVEFENILFRTSS